MYRGEDSINPIAKTLAVLLILTNFPLAGSSIRVLLPGFHGDLLKCHSNTNIQMRPNTDPTRQSFVMTRALPGDGPSISHTLPELQVTVGRKGARGTGQILRCLLGLGLHFNANMNIAVWLYLCLLIFFFFLAGNF